MDNNSKVSDNHSNKWITIQVNNINNYLNNNLKILNNNNNNVS